MLVQKVLSFLGLDHVFRAHQRADHRQGEIDRVKRVSKRQVQRLLSDIEKRPDRVDYFRQAEIDYLRRRVEAGD
jgi:hypothetical protein